ncbi:DUF6492 family protein [Ammoniphilus sp. CFH 90114]|uniref:DUF6492 family protein n=1 Tax=Ammoniphilus sp. CFH 90114 TaxID=2493665 RepID=UPI00100EBA99|nr:DUF6492 family protein [Ammoniphilus sp. CFH 90114]RXT13998.1 hypothetical protein EIZ39_07640 [Ammoniphilus sp. CFH 90114]
MGKTQQIKLDIVIPAIKKDLKVLPHVIDSIHKQIRHPIGKIFIVAPQDASMMKLCKEKHCKFIHEDTVLPILKEEIDYWWNGKNRAGWMFQQLLKLSGDTLSNEGHYLVIDADTILIQPHTFIQDDKFIFYYRNLRKKEYYRAYHRLLGAKAEAPSRSISFVSHYMVFNVKLLKELKRKIEQKHSKPWFECILQNFDRTKYAPFSEYETYGNFMYSNYRERIILEKCLNLSLKRKALQRTIQSDMHTIAEHHRSVSFHHRK